MPGSRTPGKVDWGRAEFILTGLAFLAFLTLPIRITTIYGGLPAHPLFVHVPVVLIPVSVICAVIFAFKTSWLARWGIALCAVAIVAMSSIFVTMQAGAALDHALYLSPNDAHLISEHSQAAHILAIIYVLFTAVLIVTFAAQRISGGWPTGLVLADRPLGSRVTFAGLRIALVVLAVAAGFMVYRVGDLGAKAVWAGRLGGGQPAGQPSGEGARPQGSAPPGTGSP